MVLLIGPTVSYLQKYCKVLKMFLEVINQIHGAATSKQAIFGFGYNQIKNTPEDYGNKLNIYFCCKSSNF